MYIFRKHHGPREFAFRAHAPLAQKAVFKKHARRALSASSGKPFTVYAKTVTLTTKAGKVTAPSTSKSGKPLTAAEQKYILAGEAKYIAAGEKAYAAAGAKALAALDQALYGD